MTNRPDASDRFVLWLTGLSGAGKSTLAQAVADTVRPERSVELLDGDEIRQVLSRELGFSRQDRDTNVRRIGYVAGLLARNGVGVIVAAISPYRATRQQVRDSIEQQGIAFVEVFVKAELSALIQRDTKGLYRRALAGELPHFTGVSDPYEPPVAPELVIRSSEETVEASADRIVDHLRARGLLPRLNTAALRG